MPKYHLNKSFFRSPLRYKDLDVWQIGRMFCTETTVIPTHIHLDSFELTLVGEGEGFITANGVRTKVRKGDVYLSLPCDSHKIESDADHPLKYDFFAFVVKNRKFQGVFDQITQTCTDPKSRVIQDDWLRSLVGQAIEELNEEKEFQTELSDAIFCQILISLARGYRKIKAASSPQISRAEALCYKMMNHIDTHLYTIKNLEELAEVTNYSYGYLSALFREVTSNTLTEYLRGKRMDAARLLLRERKMTATQIAELLNYSSVYAFSKAFRKHFGMSPKAYEKEQTL